MACYASLCAIRARRRLLPALAASWIVDGHVVGVSDGDTVTVLDRGNVQHKIRLSGIDAPEKGQAFGELSKETLSRLVFDETIQAQCHKKDRYEREVCNVMRGVDGGEQTTA